MAKDSHLKLQRQNKESIFILLTRLIRQLSNRRKLYFLLLFSLMLASSFAEVMSIGLLLPFLASMSDPGMLFNTPAIQPIINYYHFTDGNELILPFTLLFIVGLIISGSLRYLLLWNQTHLAHSIGADISVDIFRNILYQPYIAHVNQHSSQLISSMTVKANSVVSNSLMPFISILTNVFLLISILSILLFLEPTIALSAFIGLGFIYVGIARVSKRKLSADGAYVNSETTKVIKIIQEALGGIRDIIIDGSQALYCNTFKEIDIPLRKAGANIAIISNSPRILVEIICVIFVAMLAYFYSLQSGGIAGAIPTLGIFALAAQRLLPVMQQSFQGWAILRSGKSTLIEVLDFLEKKTSDNNFIAAVNPLTFLDKIEFRGVSFNYPNQPVSILNDINISISKGAKVGIIGVSGSGKSTFIDILMGLLEPTKGSMTVDGVNITGSSTRDWQACLAHVPQAIFLTSGSISENIAFIPPSEKIDFSRVEWAAKKAQINQMIEMLPQGYETKVGERGILLSGGQRQRIAIARALYKKAKVIIFDEATSALDADTEKSVMTSIEGLGQDITVIIVTHRVSTLKFCTEILKVDNGSIKNLLTTEIR